MLKKLIALVSSYKPPPSDVYAPVRPPTRRGDVGHDLCVAKDTEIPVIGITWIHTSVAIESRFPLWYMITARSSLHKKGLMVPIGIIDAGYQGELIIPVVNCSGQPQEILRGDYIAQCIFLEVIQPKLVVVDEFTTSERGDNGFGSTEKKA